MADATRRKDLYAVPLGDALGESDDYDALQFHPTPPGALVYDTASSDRIVARAPMDDHQKRATLRTPPTHANDSTLTWNDTYAGKKHTRV